MGEEGGERGGGGERGWSVWELVQINFLPIGGNPTRKSTHTSHRQRHWTSPLSSLRFTPTQLSQLRSSAIAPVRLRLSSPPLPSPPTPPPARSSPTIRPFVRPSPQICSTVPGSAGGSVAASRKLPPRSFFLNTCIFWGGGAIWLWMFEVVFRLPSRPEKERRTLFFLIIFFFASCTRSDTRGCCYVP